ncbi:S-layer homology domain-containing protein [Paenibacillus mendelii]|uniref:S-layer homology domain-containing protein n=1 Tax=Paenibacillus mendelii TaxID=206163 RepID=A0ABV6J4U4_9BACL|nr:S-layer homology domain-containing protein [Paenibacillus mendelii]MCQ6560468.1 S-layer homology domain-containing protein [Paenibacillus mendelii]
MEELYPMKGYYGKLNKVLLSMMLGFSTLLSVSSFPQSTYAAATFLFASPAGSGSKCTVDAPCSLDGAQAKVRTLNTSMTEDIIVYLRGGTYALTSTFELTSADSGTGGFQVIYEAYPGETPVLSGGQTIADWSLFDSGQNIYRSYVGTELNTRQLYVDGVRATRARGADNPAGFTKTTTGYTAPNTSMSSWGNQSQVEIVGFNAWKSFRCPVSSISGNAVTVQNHCWNNSQLSGTPGLNAIAWFENAYELLDEEGEWYLDRTAGYLYYKPLVGQNMASAVAVAPTLQTLLSGTGTLDEPLQNVQIKGLTFAYATWLQPSTNDGYVPLQAGFTYTGLHASATQDLTKTLGNITFRAAKSVRLERNRFTHLGGAGLVFEYGSQNNTIIGNTFDDISASAILIGDVTPSHVNPADIRERNSHNTVQSNYISHAGAEYYDSPGIFGGYTSYSTIKHNEVANLPYTGISQGWGWGTNSYAQNNQITNNYIHDVMNVLGDGGGIYTLSAQPDSTISGNHLQNMYGSYGGWGIYPDEGSAYFTITNNVVEQTGRWISMWTGTIHDNIVQHNYSDTPSMANACTNCTVTDNTIVRNGSWPAEAQTIMNHAGLEQAYWDLSPLTSHLDHPWPAWDQDGNTSKEWIAPTRGFVRLADTLSSANNAVIGSVYKNDAVIWGPQPVLQGEATSYQLNLKVLKGDRLRFVLNGDGNPDLNTISWNPTLKFDAVPAACEFIKFDVPVQLQSKINTGTREIFVTVQDDTDLTDLVPDAEISEECRSVPGIGVARDFSRMVTYDLQDDEGTFSKTWKVFVTKMSAASGIKGYNLNQEVGDTDKWVTDGSSTKVAGEGSLAISNGSAAYQGRTFQNELLEFEMKSDSAGGVEWPAISIRQKAADKVLWDPVNEGYILVFKPDVIELQRFNGGVRTVFYGNIDGIGGSEGQLPNHVFEMGKKHLVQFGALNTAEGVRLAAYVDGKKIIDYVDSGSGKISSAGYMGVYAYSAPVTLGAVPVIHNLNPEIGDTGKWVTDGSSTKVAGEGSLAVSSGSAAYQGRTFQNELLEFEMKSDSAGGVEWPAISIRQKAADKVLWDPANEGYILVFKPDVIELQRFNAGVRTVFYGNVDGMEGSEGQLPNHVFEMGKKHLVQFGALNTAEGVRLAAYVDGKKIIDYVDSGSGKITSAGYMGVYAYSAPVTLGAVPVIHNLNQEIVDTDKWVTDGSSTKDAGEGSLAVSSGSAAYQGRTFQNELLEFEMKSDSAGGVEWPAISIRQKAADKVLWDPANEGYILVFKPDVIELQRFNAGVRTVFYGNVDGMEGSEGQLPNHVFEMGKKHLVQFGALNTAEGVRLAAYVDGKKIIDYVDTGSGKITSAGYMGVYAYSAPVVLSRVFDTNQGTAGPPPTTPSTPRPGENLALNQPATAFFADGSRARMWTGFEAAKAVDGNTATYALADGEHLWQLQVDLGSVHHIDRIVVKMPENLYATEFDIRTSTDGAAFTTVKQVTGFTSGTSDNKIAETTARYVRVVAVKPDGPDQTGLEMAVSELEVYNPIPTRPLTTTPMPTPTPIPTPAPTPKAIPALDNVIAASVKHELEAALINLINRKPVGEDAQTTQRKATNAAEEAIWKLSELKVNDFVIVDEDTSVFDVEVDSFTDVFASIKAHAGELNAILARLHPKAEPAKVMVTLDLGEQSAKHAEIRLSKEFVQQAKAAGLASIAVMINGVSLTIDVNELLLHGSTTLHVSKQAPSAAEDVTHLKVVSDVYAIEFTNAAKSKVTFAKPVIVKLPIAGTAGVDPDLFSLAKVMDGKLVFYGGRYNPAAKYFEAERHTFSTYAVVENKVIFNDTAGVEAWAGQAIRTAAAKGIIEGRGEGNYAPNDNVTRAEFAVMIVRTFHLEDSTGALAFKDVQANDWYRSSLAAAVKAGIINGRSDDRFAPNETITRAEMAAIAARALTIVKGYKIATNAKAALLPLGDANEIHASLADGIAYAFSKGIVIGSGGSLHPNRSSTRAEAAVMISRLLMQ